MSTARTRTTKRAAAPERLAPILRELREWRARAVPDPDAPLDADDVARLVRDCFAALGIEPAAAESFSVNTVYFYRRKDIIDEPDGRTSAARFTLRHVWQAAGARLAGFLGLLSLAEARRAMRSADDDSLMAFVAARVADARGRQAARQSTPAARPLRATPRAVAAAPATYSAPIATQITATIVPLGDNAMCLIPAGHASLRSRAAARALVDSLAAALGLHS